MPEYLVRFDQPMQYQPDHPKVNRRVEGICVHAPSPEAAVTHALRVTRGPGIVLSVRPVEDQDEEAAAVRLTFTSHLPEGTVVGEVDPRAH